MCYINFKISLNFQLQLNVSLRLFYNKCIIIILFHFVFFCFVFFCFVFYFALFRLVFLHLFSGKCKFMLMFNGWRRALKAFLILLLILFCFLHLLYWFSLLFNLFFVFFNLYFKFLFGVNRFNMLDWTE